MLNKARIKSKPSILWCYKKELGFIRYFVLLIFKVMIKVDKNIL
jgi:hypothetical protein